MTQTALEQVMNSNKVTMVTELDRKAATFVTNIDC